MTDTTQIDYRTAITDYLDQLDKPQLHDVLIYVRALANRPAGESGTSFMEAVNKLNIDPNELKSK